MTTRLETIIKNSFLLLIIGIFFVCCKSTIIKTDNELFKGKIFGTDIIENETIALKYAELVFRTKFANTDFEKMQPFKISSIQNDKIWHITAIDNSSKYKKKSYELKILKNTGQVLDFKLYH